MKNVRTFFSLNQFFLELDMFYKKELRNGKIFENKKKYIYKIWWCKNLLFKQIILQENWGGLVQKTDCFDFFSENRPFVRNNLFKKDIF